MRAISGLFIALLLIAPGAIGSTTAISIDGIDGMLRPDSALAGTVLGFRIHYTNTSDSGFNITNGWVVYSPDGATWTDSAGGNFRGSNLGPIGIDTTGLLSKAQFPTVYALRTFSSTTTVARADGISPDTVAFSGAGSDIGQGLPPHFDAHAFTIRIRTKPGDWGKTICIDSTMRYPSTNRWKWAVLYGGPVPDTVIPTWSGARCIHLVWKFWEPIAFYGCPTTITASHCVAFTADFNASIPNGDSSDIRYSLVSGPGTIDSTNGSWSAGPLATGIYTLRVQATNIHTGDSAICTTNIASTNVLPQFSATNYSATAIIGKLSTFTPTVTGLDCDLLTYTLLDNDGAEGPVSINAATGQLSFTPTSADSARIEPIVMRIAVNEPLPAGLGDSATVSWHFVGGCSGTVGNVDCDPAESVDIGDLTFLIAYLFRGASLCSTGEANCNGDELGRINLLDVTFLISHLYISFVPLPPCQ